MHTYPEPNLSQCDCPRKPIFETDTWKHISKNSYLQCFVGEGSPEPEPPVPEPETAPVLLDAELQQSGASTYTVTDLLEKAVADARCLFVPGEQPLRLGGGVTLCGYEDKGDSDGSVVLEFCCECCNDDIHTDAHGGGDRVFMSVQKAQSDDVCELFTESLGQGFPITSSIHPTKNAFIHCGSAGDVVVDG